MAAGLPCTHIPQMEGGLRAAKTEEARKSRERRQPLVMTEPDEAWAQ